MKAIIIARVSTEEQREAGNSLPAQIERLKKYCQNKGFELLKEFSFDESAYKNKRKDFDAILDFVIKQKDKVAVCFDKVDRLSRNVFDKRVSVLYDKALNDGIELHFASDGQIINSRLSAAEKFNFSMSLGLSKYYSDAISDNVKRAQEQKLSKGEFPGKAHYGYKNITISDSKTDIVVDEYTSNIVKKTFELYGTRGYSMELLCLRLKDDYGITWQPGTADRILRDKFYYGIMSWNGQEYPHRYPPIISKALFDQVQQHKASFNKRRFKYAGKAFFYRSLILCGKCNHAITPEDKKGHFYYYCSKKRAKHTLPYMKEEEITEQIANFFRRMQIPQDVAVKISNNLELVRGEKREFKHKQLDELNKEHETLNKMKRNLYWDKNKGSITAEEYDEYRQELVEKISEIEGKLYMIKETDDNYEITAKYLLDLLSRAPELFLNSKHRRKKTFDKIGLPEPYPRWSRSSIQSQ